jgi:hypothetical protein
MPSLTGGTSLSPDSLKSVAAAMPPGRESECARTREPMDQFRSERSRRP